LGAEGLLEGVYGFVSHSFFECGQARSARVIPFPFYLAALVVFDFVGQPRSCSGSILYLFAFEMYFAQVSDN
jgi:hypothetical protein